MQKLPKSITAHLNESPRKAQVSFFGIKQHPIDTSILRKSNLGIGIHPNTLLAAFSPKAKGVRTPLGQLGAGPVGVEQGGSPERKFVLRERELFLVGDGVLRQQGGQNFFFYEGGPGKIEGKWSK